MNLTRRTLLITACVLIAAVVLAVLWLRPPAHYQRIDASPFENDAVEALVRDLLQQDGLRDTSVCFLAFGEGGASPHSDFIDRFADCHHPAVLALNATVNPSPSLVLEKHNGHAGLVIKIIQLRELIPNDYDITVSLSNLPSGRDQVIYHVINSGGNWTVKKRP